MPLIKYIDKGFLREHPFVDPLTEPAPVQTHSYIFPGDEIVLYHNISLPDDVLTQVVYEGTAEDFSGANWGPGGCHSGFSSDKFSRAQQLVIGATYIMNYEVVSYISGDVFVRLGGTDGVPVSAVGIYNDTVIATSNMVDGNRITFISGGELCIDNFKLERVITVGTDMNDIKLVSAKAYVIAQKINNVFSEEFSREFLSCRIFELDSFSVAFNNLNARIIPWGTPIGADGYAPNVDVKQDRNWKLPSGDFRREINFFTLHEDGRGTWEYWFYFPILFRWEYWIALLTADNYFYNASQNQDGLNQWWYHYFVDAIWNIKSRLDLNILINGTPYIVRSELNLTPSLGDVNDYNSNPDYIDRVILTGKVGGGAPSNAPCFIYGSENTVVLATLTKVAAWEFDERIKVSAVVWIEPFEDAGITVRTRGSSSYLITPESVFKGLTLDVTDNDGIGITDESGSLFVVYGAPGSGALCLFDTDVQLIKIVAVIDYQKLNQVYPGITKFTLYARLYNSFIDPVDITRKGEEIKQDATLVSLAPADAICFQKAPQCAFVLDVYADEDDADDLKNDKSDFYYYGDGTINELTLTLQKNDNSCGDGDWEDSAEIINNNYGKFFAFGKTPDFSGIDFTDDYDKKYSGVFLEWRKVLLAFGAGKYRMKITRTDAFDVETIAYDQRLFCLHAYNCNLVDRTVRIETVNEGLRGTFGQNDLTDYAGGWAGQIRLKGLLKFKASTYVKEFNQYGEAAFNAFKPIINEQQPKFTLSIRPVPGWMDFILSTNILQADEIKVTDYNLANRHVLIKVPLMNDGDLTPTDNNLANPLSTVQISMAYGFNNLRKRNSQ